MGERGGVEPEGVGVKVTVWWSGLASRGRACGVSWVGYLPSCGLDSRMNG